MPVYIENRLDIFNEKKTTALKGILICLQRQCTQNVCDSFILSCTLFNIQALGSPKVTCNLIKWKQRRERGHLQSSQNVPDAEWATAQRSLVKGATLFGSFLGA